MSPGPSWEFSAANRFTVGAIGEPGARVFYLQVFADGVEVNVKCEKQQAAALSEHLVNLLEDIPEEPGADEPTSTPTEALPPTDIAWTVGSISIGVDRNNREIAVLLEELELDDETGIGAPGRLRVSLSPEQVRGFAGQIDALQSRSRPLCRLCDRPIDPTGHACPRLN